MHLRIGGVVWPLTHPLAGYAMWTCLSTPCCFEMEGMATEEPEPWH